MSSSGATGTVVLDVLLFTVNGACYGVDVEQIAGIGEHAGEVADDLHWFHDLLDCGGSSATYRLPTELSIKTENGQSCRIVIDSMEDIRAFNTDVLCPFPSLVEPFALQKGLWGVVVVEGRMVLLVDFLLLLKRKRAGAARLGGDV